LAVGWLTKNKPVVLIPLPELTDQDYKSIKAIKRGKRKGTVTYNENIASHIAQPGKNINWPYRTSKSSIPPVVPGHF